MKGGVPRKPGWQGRTLIRNELCSAATALCVLSASAEMSKHIKTTAACEIRSVIRFLNARGTTAAEIHRQICDVYGEGAMSDSMVRRWVRLFSEGRENVHDDERSGRPSLVTDDMLRPIEEKMRTFPRNFAITSSRNCLTNLNIENCVHVGYRNS